LREGATGGFTQADEFFGGIGPGTGGGQLVSIDTITPSIASMISLILSLSISPSLLQ
jgi:hypothetical protein